MSNLTLKVATTKEVDGLEMGVLGDGKAFMSARALATVCGIAPSSLLEQTKNWRHGFRTSKFARFLTSHGIDREVLHFEIPESSVHAYDEEIAGLILEFYAFEAQARNVTALENYRRIFRAGLRLFVYAAVGYDPTNRTPPEFLKFYDRLILNAVPQGYFSVFQEMCSLVLQSMQLGLPVDEHTVPDISIGKTFSDFWGKSLSSRFAERRKWPHKYPDYFPQARANDVIEAWVYPIEALAEFHIWLEDTYMPEKFPKYLDGKVAKKQLAPSVKALILETIEDNVPQFDS
jgi:hypothetical protein